MKHQQALIYALLAFSLSACLTPSGEAPSEPIDDLTLRDGDPCNVGTFYAQCNTENTLITCEEGVLVFWACGPDSVCNAQAADCGYCGDGTRDPGEDCDDANGNDFDGCKNDCTLSGTPCDPFNYNVSCEEAGGSTFLVTCEDGSEVRKECDGGRVCDEDSESCGFCGDAILDIEAGEECEDLNITDGDGCENDCIRTAGSICGNGFLDPGEFCDDGNSVSGDGCRSDCMKIEVCGDGILDEGGLDGEVCDDDGAMSGDGCRADCRGFELCGDGLLDVGEQCDDSNNTSGDGCSFACEPERCGDGAVNNAVPGDHPLTEQCDDGNNVSDDGCDALCQSEFCGDGISSPGELCYQPRFTVDVVGAPVELEHGDFDQDGDLDLVVLNSVDSSVQLLDNDGAGHFSSVGFFSTGLEGLAAKQIVAGDFDQDGDLDLAALGLWDPGASLSEIVYVTLLENDGAGLWLINYVNLELTSQSFDFDKYSLLSEDFDSDGDLDLAVNTGGQTDSDGILDENLFQGGVTILRNDGLFSFTIFSALGTALSQGIIGKYTIAAADMDGDGDSDLVSHKISYYQYGDGSWSFFSRLSVLKNDGGIAFHTLPPMNLAISLPEVTIDYTPTAGALACADFDGDADVDVILLGVVPGDILILRNNGTGFLSVASHSNTNDLVEFYDAAVGDLDRDGLPDLVVSKGGSLSSVWQNQGALSFSADTIFPLGHEPVALTIGDFNNDGVSDFASANKFDGNLSVLLSSDP